ncbi:19716_t:CDS:2 [Funneliformis geosporum]|uniref:13822_t:CDS:1 n=1 Tax=Funneliformis geosporum TaxID=1117311 RepID=A0A9W4WT91_9GLOM|nr:13822_t:CDS:2 [Funneliformis geosporum]CAI2162945.1 19716_t:CDS:2 [Funneliformis geosporum]
MNFPKYDGNIHPVEWVNDFQNHINLKEKLKADDNINYAISLVNATIKLPTGIDSFEKLCGETSKFISNFRQLCYNAEINDIDEQKKYLIQSLPSNNYLFDELSKRKEKINSTNVLIKEFEEIVTEESNLIRHGSIVALKHVVTGKYLSSIKDLNYKTGSEVQMVFVNDLFDSNALWKITFKSGKELASYTDIANFMCLEHKNSGKTLGIYIRSINGYKLYNDIKSPVTSHKEVNCNRSTNHNVQWKFKNSKLENYQGYLKSNDTINLCINNVKDQQVFLRSHDFQFTIGNDTFQEVVCHNERLGGSDEWCLELIKQKNMP